MRLTDQSSWGFSWAYLGYPDHDLDLQDWVEGLGLEVLLVIQPSYRYIYLIHQFLFPF